MGNLVTHQFTDKSVIHSELCHLQNWAHNYGLCVTQWRMAYPSYPIPLIPAPYPHGFHGPRVPVMCGFIPYIHWIGLRENLNRKPWFLPLNMGVSCKFSLKPTQWYIHGFAKQVRANSEMRWDIFAHTWDEDLADAMLGAAQCSAFDFLWRAAGYLWVSYWDWGYTQWIPMAWENMMIVPIKNSLG